MPLTNVPLRYTESVLTPNYKLPAARTGCDGIFFARAFESQNVPQYVWLEALEMLAAAHTFSKTKCGFSILKIECVVVRIVYGSLR